MQSKTKIVVLHLKEVIYTGIFAVLGILFVVLLIIMFLPDGKKDAEKEAENASAYVPGIYTTSLALGDSTVNIEVVVDEDNINSIRLVNLNEAVTTMYPLIEPSFQNLIDQILTSQSLEDITYSSDNKYTCMVLMDAIEASLTKATAVPKASETP